MSLLIDPAPVNILPYDGTVDYYGPVMSNAMTNFYLHHLMNGVPWKNDEAIMFGRHLITKRKVAWYGDEGFSYTYSRITRQALPWTDDLLTLKERMEELTKTVFNSCLLNLYHNGSEGMAWHSDNEKTLTAGASIASLSFGAARKFAFKHKQSKEVISLVLEPGSLLNMKGDTQIHWLHRLPLSTKVNEPRINLTFRSMQR